METSDSASQEIRYLGLREGQVRKTCADCYAKCAGVRAFNGVLNESHRAFVVSADLLCESAKEPWRQTSDPVEKDFGDILKFICSQKGPTDMSMAFDGLSRSARKIIDEGVGELSGAAEVSLTYTKAPNSWRQEENKITEKTGEVETKGTLISCCLEN